MISIRFRFDGHSTAYQKVFKVTVTLASDVVWDSRS